jgi:hypothetical protein
MPARNPARTINFPAYQPPPVRLKAGDPSHPALHICKALRVSQTTIGMVAGGVTQGVVGQMLTGRAHCSSRIKTATQQALAEAGYDYDLGALFDD